MMSGRPEGRPDTPVTPRWAAGQGSLKRSFVVRLAQLSSTARSCRIERATARVGRALGRKRILLNQRSMACLLACLTAGAPVVGSTRELYLTPAHFV